jgi:glutamate racemase
MPHEQAIGVFDSGIGGLTVVRELKRLLPRERIIYLGDTARLPFGSKSPLTIQRYSLQNADFLLGRGIKFLVIACNTASAWALEQVKAHADVPVVGVIEPGCREAVSRTASRRIGVIGTSATVRSEAYPSGIRRLLTDAHVISRQCPLLVPIVEEGWLEHPATDLIIAEYLSGLRSDGIDTLVLGCTHYPLLIPAIARFMGTEVSLISSSEAVARVVQAELERLDLLNPGNGDNDRYFLTDHSATFQRVMKLFMGQEIMQVEQVDISSLAS